MARIIAESMDDLRKDATTLTGRGVRSTRPRSINISSEIKITTTPFSSASANQKICRRH
jgi:hypothetical protein